MAKKIPLLQRLSEEYPELSKDQLTAYVVCKNVKVDGELVTQPKIKVLETSNVSMNFEKFVSRGGFKLEEALKAFDIDVEGKVILDAGSSTGGFTDCLLQYGAKGVHSVDVGYNQLDYSLRVNDNVYVHEKQNIMNLMEVDPPAEGAVCDLSFRSISGAASHILSLCSNTFLICLIKPQFEVPRWRVDFNGVVEDLSFLEEIMLHVYDVLQEDGVGIHNLILSPIKGRKGNKEFLALLKKGEGISKQKFSELYNNCVNKLN